MPCLDVIMIVFFSCSMRNMIFNCIFLSVLGPLLFLICMNDIFSCSNYLSFILFADNTIIFFQHKNISELTKIVNHELSFVATWFKANKLILHPDKTKFILFHPARKKEILMVFLLTLIRTVLIE